MGMCKLNLDWNGMQANEGEPSMSLERFSHLYDLMQMGNRAFRQNHFEEVWPAPFSISSIIASSHPKLISSIFLMFQASNKKLHAIIVVI